MFTDVSVIYVKEEDSFADSDNYGVGISLGSEFYITDRLNLIASINFSYLDVDFGDSDSVDFSIGASYSLFDPISVYFNYNFDEDSNQSFSAGLSFSW